MTPADSTLTSPLMLKAIQNKNDAELKSLVTFYAGDKLYNNLKTGKFYNLPVLTWNGPDTFLFTQSPHKPFKFETSSGRTIEPQTMPTDGGSIPYIFRMLKKYSPWGYAPAFIIHDWLFHAHKNNISPDNDWAFEETADIMAECIKTLMEVGFTNVDGKLQILEKEEDTLYLMFLAVKSFEAKKIWNE